MDATYPLQVEAELGRDLSRWLWLVKWFLAIPHFIVLGFLWIAFWVSTVVAFFAILFTARYPRAIFEFNVGVLRWSWRVTDYAFGVLGTDRYPPFTLAEVPGYPAHLEVAYPDRLSRGLPLVKWFLAIPHVIIVGILAGGGSWIAWNLGHASAAPWGNLIGVLVLVAAVILAATGSYPRPLFDLILGLNRWVLRVTAYVGLMTDQYPPFRLDMGGAEPNATLTIPRPSTPTPSPSGTPPPPGRPDLSPPARPRGWSAGRITSLVMGSILALVSVGLLGGGGFLTWAVTTQRDAQGFYTTGVHRFSTSSSALTGSAAIDQEPGDGWFLLRGDGWSFGTGTTGAFRIRVTPSDPSRELFVGVAPQASVERYLQGVSRTAVTDPAVPTYRSTPGGAPGAAPATEYFWLASSSGTATRTLVWPISEGRWTVVVMNGDGSRGIDVRANAAARIPVLPWVAAGLLIGGVILLGGSILMIAIPIRRAGRAAPVAAA